MTGLIASCAIFCSILLLVQIRFALAYTRGGVFSPTVITSAGLLLMYSLRPLYILSTGYWGIAPNYVQPIDGDLKDILNSSIAATIGVAVFCASTIAYLTSNRNFRIQSKKAEVIPLSRSEFSIVKVALWLSMLLSIGILLYGIISAGSVNSYIEMLGSRATLLKDTFGDFAFYFELVFFLATSSYLMYFAHSSAKLGRVSLQNYIYGFTILFLLTSLGGRSNILFLIISIFYIHTLLQNSNKLPLRKLMVLSIAVLIFGVAYRVVLRDVHFSANANTDLVVLLRSSVSNFFEFLVGGFDFVQLDALTILISDYSPSFQYGYTILSALVSFVPRAIWPSKPYGAMTEFTKEYFPAHYAHSQGGEFVVSWFGEGYMNFGIFGIAFSALSMAFFVIYLERKSATTKSIYYLAAISMLISRPFNIFKADFFNNFMAIGKLLFVPILVYCIYQLLKQQRRGISHSANN